MNDGNAALPIMFAIMGAIFILPTIVAFGRSHPNRWVILLLNCLVGWTGIAWLAALIWAMNKVHISPSGSHGGESGINLFVNDEKKVRIVNQPDAPKSNERTS